MATIKDVARASGVSTATVSYILNNRPGNFTPETRDRVLQAMRDLKYRPSALFGSPQVQGTNTIGVIYPQPAGRGLVDAPYYTYLLDGIISCTAMRHWHVTLFSDLVWEDATRSLRVYCDGRCDGLILIGPNPDSEIVLALKERGLPFVLINSGNAVPDVSSVDVDNIASAEQMTRHLLTLGHRRIAMLPGNSSYDGTQQRIEGYRKAMREAGIPSHPEWIPPGAFSESSGYERTLTLMTLRERPTALFCGNEAIAQGAYAALRECRIAIPQEVSVAGFDGLDFAKAMDPPLTTMKQPLQQMGKRAVEILLSCISQPGDEQVVEKQLYTTEFIERRSTAPSPSLAS